MGLASDRIETVEKALKKGFAAKRAKVFLFTEKSDYKNFIRMFVISNSFRGKNNKERLGEIFSTLEEFGAKSEIATISLCVAMTEREYEREFGRGTFLGVDLHKTYRQMKSRQSHRSPRVLSRA